MKHLCRGTELESRFDIDDKGGKELAEDGVIRSVPREWLTTHMPTYVRYVDTNDTAWPSTQVDGVQYAIPNVSAGNATGHILGVRDERHWVSCWTQTTTYSAGSLELPERVRSAVRTRYRLVDQRTATAKRSNSSRR